MAKCVRKILVFTPLLVVFVLGGLLLWDWWVASVDSDAICSTLAKNDPTNVDSKIIATGKFTSHNESFIYIGDIIAFELRVVYDHDRVEVKERSMRNFNAAPYKILSQSDVVTKRHSECSTKTIHFTLQALDVDPGSKNRFKHLNPEGLDRTPEVEYAGEGLVRTIGPSYEAPYVVTVTDGKISPVPDNSGKYPLSQKKQRVKTWQDIARFYLGIAMILGIMVWIALPLIMRKIKRTAETVKHIDITDLFPELFGDGDVHARLTRAYFRLEEILEKSLREKVSRVFSGDMTEEQKEDIIRELREYVEGRYGNDGLA